MSLAILAGLPQGVITRHKRFQVVAKGWPLIRCDSKRAKADLTTCWLDTIRAANSSGQHGAHILAFHHREDEHKRFEADIYSRHRLVWLDHGLLRQYGTNAFNDLIDVILDFESVWRTRIRPTIDSPLMLPEKCFRATSGLRDIWIRAHRIGVEADDIDGVTLLLEQFRNRHFAKGCWTDDRSHVYTRAVAMHGLSHDPNRHHKFTFEIPNGFHFDVRESRGREFTIRDHQGILCRFGQFTNIDPHGHVRGGS